MFHEHTSKVISIEQQQYDYKEVFSRKRLFSFMFCVCILLLASLIVSDNSKAESVTPEITLPPDISKLALAPSFDNDGSCNITTPLPEPITFPVSTTQIALQVVFTNPGFHTYHGKIEPNFGGPVLATNCNKYTICMGQVCQVQAGATFKRIDGQPLPPNDYTFSFSLDSGTPVLVPFTILAPAPIVTHFAMQTPDVAIPDTPFNITIKALDEDGNVVPDYRGQIHLTSTDSQAMLPPDYVFSESDSGNHTFLVTLKTAGSQEITVNDVATSSISATATITVVQPPLIIIPPANQKVGSGQFATLTVTATGDDLSYQWYEGFGGDSNKPVSNATSSSFTTPALTTTTNYWVRVTNAGGSVDSNTATITVVQPPEILTQPVNQKVGSGRSATLTITATGDDLSYQWYEGFSGDSNKPVSNATSSSFTTPALTMTTNYWVHVTNLGGSADSATATITVIQPPKIPVQPVNQKVGSGQSVTLTVTATGDDLSYQWYEGVSGDSNKPVSNATSSSFTTPALTAITNYWVRVTNLGGSVDSNTVTITVIQPPVITKQPVSETIKEGMNVTLTVTADGEELNYQWYQGERGIRTDPVNNGTTSILNSPVLTETTRYWVRVSNIGGYVNSDTAVIKVEATPLLEFENYLPVIQR